ncbi:MAG TPA: plastocyanin/azurin family copper-binding protein [Acidimicrobiia bacterium]|nr:plastocyanin/azurin family copper-binding protein [Acidimicrobiia bacterium]
MGKRGLAFATAFILVIAAAACSDSDDGEALVDLRGKASDGAYPEVEVEAIDNTFREQNIRIDPGVTVAFTNNGRNDHDVRPADPEQDFGGDFGVERSDFTPGDEYEFRFDDPGVYRYFCSLHGSSTRGMIGKVVVGDVDPDSGEPEGPDGGDASGTISVPDDYPTIQAAVDAASPGSLVLIEPGTYREAVTVTTPDIVIRGVDRNETILDGEFELDNGFKVLADGVAIENITARNFTVNGFFWTGVTGYRGSYLTAVRNGDYGVYAFDSVKGQFDNSYGAGSPDAGFYIGQCYPCDALITDVYAEYNGLGYSGTNAGGNLLIVNSEFSKNRIGISPNSGTYEEEYPERETTIVGNIVRANSNPATPSISIAQTAFGNGILLAGGLDNVVERNVVLGHDNLGIGIIPLPEKVLDPDNPDAIDFESRGNRIVGNLVRDSGVADLFVVTNLVDPTDGGENCFADNEFSTSLPAKVEGLLPCDGTPPSGFEAAIARFVEVFTAEYPAGLDYTTVSLPPLPDLPNMPDARTAPAEPATDFRFAIDLDEIERPDVG